MKQASKFMVILALSLLGVFVGGRILHISDSTVLMMMLFNSLFEVSCYLLTVKYYQNRSMKSAFERFRKFFTQKPYFSILFIGWLLYKIFIAPSSNAVSFFYVDIAITFYTTLFIMCLNNCVKYKNEVL